MNSYDVPCGALIATPLFSRPLDNPSTPPIDQPSNTHSKTLSASHRPHPRRRLDDPSNAGQPPKDDTDHEADIDDEHHECNGHDDDTHHQKDDHDDFPYIWAQLGKSTLPRAQRNIQLARPSDVQQAPANKATTTTSTTATLTMTNDNITETSVNALRTRLAHPIHRHPRPKFFPDDLPSDMKA